MAEWLLMAGRDIAAASSATVRFWPTLGFLQVYLGESEIEYVARDSYTLKNFYVNTYFNTINTGTSTFKIRKNGADGNSVISIGAGVTGTFEDTVNTDSLSDGDAFNVKSVMSGSSGYVLLTVISTILVGDTTILATNWNTDSVSAGLTRYNCIKGILEVASVEADSPYTFRTSATLSNLRAYINGNTINTGTSTIRTRVDEADGNQVLSIGSGVTGAFEDTSNTDVIAVGGRVNYKLVASGASGSFSFPLIQVKSDSTAMQIAVGKTGGGGDADYMGLEGSPDSASSTESRMQVKARISFRATNGFCLVILNTTDSASIRLRKNGANGNLVISITGNTTGVFEDLVNSDDIVATDLVNWLVATTGGTISFTLYGFEQYGAVTTYPSDPATRVTELVHRYTSANVPSNKVLTLEVLLGGATFRSITVLSQEPPTEPELVPVPPSAIPVPPPPDAPLQDPFAPPVFEEAFIGYDPETGKEMWLQPDGTIILKDPEEQPPRAGGGAGPSIAI